MKIPIIKNHFIFFAAAAFIFFAIAAQADTLSSAINIKSSQTSPLLQNYLQMHPVDMIVIKQIQIQTIRELAQLQQLSLDDLAVQINTARPHSGILPNLDPFYLHELKKHSNEKLSSRKSITPAF